MSSTQQTVGGLLTQRQTRHTTRPLFTRVRLTCVHLGVRCLMLLYGAAMAIAKLIGPRRRPLPENFDVLLTATFYSPNWIAAHLHPLAASARCRRIWMVAAAEVPSIKNVVAVYPPRLLTRLVGRVPARLLTFVWVALRRRPHVIGGFHLLLNGLIATLLAKLCGSHALYICVGGPTEVMDGGARGENRLFRRLVTPDAFIEKRLLRAVDQCDYVVTMGRKAGTFLRNSGIKANIFQNPGGLNGSIFHPGQRDKVFDVAIVGRAASVKRIDTFLRAIATVRESIPGVRAVVVGDGPLRRELGSLAKQLFIEDNVFFAGQQPDVAMWLQSSRIFALTSDSEGISLAMMEAMSCGLPVVVSRVGDLDEMVAHGKNGFLVAERTPENFAACFTRLLQDDALRERMSIAARITARALEYSNAGKLWDSIFGQAPASAAPSLRGEA